jgi:CBS domain-containing protein
MPQAPLVSPMTVQEILDDKPVTGRQLFALAPGSPVSEAVAMMVRESISSVLILEGAKLAGILTLRELLYGLEKFGPKLLDARAGEVMNAAPARIAPGDSADKLRSIMTEKHVTHVPVLDGEELVGVISFHDIARSAVREAAFENKLLKQYIKNWPSQEKAT